MYRRTKMKKSVSRKNKIPTRKSRRFLRNIYFGVAVDSPAYRFTLNTTTFPVFSKTEIFARFGFSIYKSAVIFYT